MPPKLPHSEESERATLAALLLEPERLEEVRAILAPEDYYLERHRIIYEACLYLGDNGSGLDLRTLQARLEDMGAFEKVGGISYLASLDLDLPDLRETVTYAGIVKERALRRRAIEAAQDVATRAQAPEVTVPELLAGWKGAVEGLEATAKPLRVVEATELLEMDLPPREPLLRPILRRKDLGMLYAWRGGSKTWVALGMSAAVAAGGKFLAWEAPEARSVLYVDGEMPAEAIQERLAAILEACDLELKAPLRILTPDLQERGMPNLATPEGQAMLEQHIGEGVELVVLDHLSALFRGVGENEAESAEAGQDLALRLRRKGVACLLVHHAGKSGQQRGTSRREDVLDLVIALRRPADYNPSEGSRFEVHFEKARAAFGHAVEPFEARLDTDAFGGPLWTMRDLESATYQQVLDLHREGVSQTDIAKELGKNRSTVSRHIRRARERGEI